MPQYFWEDSSIVSERANWASAHKALPVTSFIVGNHAVEMESFDHATPIDIRQGLLPEHSIALSLERA